MSVCLCCSCELPPDIAERWYVCQECRNKYFKRAMRKYMQWHSWDKARKLALAACKRRYGVSTIHDYNRKSTPVDRRWERVEEIYGGEQEED